MTEEYEEQLKTLASSGRKVTSFSGSIVFLYVDPEGPFESIVSERRTLQIIRTLKAYPPLPTDRAAHPLELKVLEQADQIIAELTAYKLRNNEVR